MSDQQRASIGAALKQLVVPFVFVALVAIPILYYGWNSEMARWTAARAEILYRNGEVPSAISMLKKAVERAPHNVDLQLLLAGKLMSHQQADQALAIIDDAIARSADPQPALRSKAECLVYLDRSSEALATLKSLSDYVTSLDFDEPERLNELAYFRALAGEELESAKDNIDKAIQSLQIRTWWLDGFPMPLLDQTILAATMIARRVDQPMIVLKMLNERIDVNADLIAKLDQESSSFVYRCMSEGFPIKPQYEQDVKTIQQTKYSARQVLSLLLSVRALVWQDLGRQEDALVDRRRIVTLGFDATNLVDQIPDDWTLLYVMYVGAMYLDTRAVVSHARQPGSAEALRDVDAAVLAMRLLELTDRSALQNSIRDNRGNQFDAMQLRRQEATLRMHRAKVLLRRGQIEQAEQDFQRIEELGFDRRQMLF